MRSPTDALRSVKRYVALTLGEDWEVRLSGEQGVFHRPYARVAQVPNISPVTESWWTTRYIASYQIAAFPKRMDSSDESQAEALRVADALVQATAGPGVQGAHIRPPQDSRQGTPARVPLYDYEGIPLRGPDAFVDEDRRNPADFLKLEAPPDTNVVPHADDELLYSVVMNIRMSWLRSAAVPSAARTTATVRVEADERYG